MTDEIFDSMAEDFWVEFGRHGTYEEVLEFWEKKNSHTEEELREAKFKLLERGYGK